MGTLLTNGVRLGVLIAACGLLWSVEAMIPLFRFRGGRLQRSVPNLMLALGVVLTNLVFASVLAALSGFVVQHRFGLLSRWRMGSPVLLISAIAGLDFFAYLSHFLLHKIPLGWRFHQVHHSEMEVDVTTALRQHPGETLWRIAWQAVGTALLGLPFWVVPVYLSVSTINAFAEHANVRMSERWDKWLRLLFVTPNMHKIHHSRAVAETDSNYSNIFSFWDRLFKTHTPTTNYVTLRYGLEGFDEERQQALTRLISEPFRVRQQA